MRVDNSSSPAVFITGASRGIGRALAEGYAQRGYPLALFARSQAGLDMLAADLRQRYAIAVAGYACDVRNAVEVEVAFRRAQAACGVPGIIILNAGVSQGAPVAEMDTASVEHMVDLYQTNVFGALRCLAAVLPRMIAAGRGQVVGISSLAAYRALGGKHAYAASKSALSAHLEGMRLSLYAYGISVSTICPGFIKTDLTAKNSHVMPFIMEVDYAAEKIIAAIAAKKNVYNFPLSLYLIARLSRLLPERVLAAVIRMKKGK